MKMDTTQKHIQENHNELFTQSVSQMEEFLRNTITDEIKNACPGVMIITLTINEYETLHRLLSESSERKIQDARRAQLRDTTQLYPVLRREVRTCSNNAQRDRASSEQSSELARSQEHARRIINTDLSHEIDQRPIHSEIYDLTYQPEITSLTLNVIR